MTPIPHLLNDYEMSATATFQNEYNNNLQNNYQNNNNNNDVVRYHRDKSNNNNINSVVQKRRSDDGNKMSSCSATLPKGKTCEFHPPPSDDIDYSDNDTVFGRILQGEAPALVLSESRNLLAFQDIHPRAPLHGLIIPKRYIKNIASLTPRDLPLLQEMYGMAMQLLQQHHPAALEKMDYVLCFHVPPFTSVDHLHLHVLAPASQMKFFYKKIKYTPETRWCTGFDYVVTRLRAGQSSSPYYPLPPIYYES